MAHFGWAVGLFLLAQVAMLAGLSFPVQPLLAPTSLAVAHLLVIGWLTLLMLGALHQFLPVITGKAPAAGAGPLVSLVGVLAGLAAMEVGFFALGGRLPAGAAAALPLGGVMVLAGALVAVLSLARILWRARPLPFAARFIALGLVFLLATIGMGLVMALALTVPGRLAWPGALVQGLRLHLISGLIGWFTLTAMGVSYRLLSMFTLAPEDRGRLGGAVLWLTAAGVAGAWLCELASGAGAAVPVAALASALALVGAGLVLYLVDMVRLYRARQRKGLELNTGMARLALAGLAAALAASLALAVLRPGQASAGAAGYLALFGWLSGLGLSQLYKIVPFLTWLERYAPAMGKQPVPRVQDLVDERRDRPWFALYFAAVAAASLFAALEWTTAWRIAAAGQLIASLMIARALWLVRFGPTPQPSAAPTASAGARFQTWSKSP